jgi:hypothetical protein
MRPEIHGAALRAASRIAFFSTIVSCGGAVDSPASVAADPVDATAPTRPAPPREAGADALATIARDANAPDVPDVADVADATPEVDASNVGVCQGANALTCCEDRVHAAWPDGGDLTEDGGLSADTKGCCQMLETHYDEALAADGGDEAWTWGDDVNTRWRCCEALEWQGTTCTPWGPPVPPPMPRAVA